jgi:hypothetical protein
MGILLDRYHAGDCRAVWRELLAYGNSIPTSPALSDAEEIAYETMRRAKTNIKTILARLPEIGYKLAYPIDAASGSISAYSEPSPDVDADIRSFEKTFGPIPLSIKAWYKQIGTVCLCWDQEAEAPLPEDWAEALLGTGVYLDPLVVWPPDYTLNEAGNEETIVEGEGVIRFAVSMSPDYYHKDNISGGYPYCFALPDSAADSPVLYEPHKTTFVEYLRIAFSWGGFPGLELLGNRLPRSLNYLRDAMIPL